MRREEEAMMLVRAQLLQRLAALQHLPYARRPQEFAAAVHEFHAFALSFEFAPVVRLAEALERVAPGPSSARSIQLLLDRMRDAIDCDRLDQRAGEALMASVSIRMAF